MVKPYNPPQFPPLDLTYWHVKDKDWMAARKEQWAKLEPMLKHRKSSRGMTIIKQYFLKGKLPDWEKLRDWENNEGHLDLYLYLYLHPSSDKSYLIQLRDQYIKSLVITKSDINRGFSLFLDMSIYWGSTSYDDDGYIELVGRIDTVIYTGENEFYFDVLMEGLDYLDEELGFYSYSMVSGEKIEKAVIGSRRSGFFAYFIFMSDWLCVKNMTKVNEDFLFQYDRPLEWWYDCRPIDEDAFDNEQFPDTTRKQFKIALYRIYHFDTQKEGDTCRTRFVHKMRKILDERPFIKEFEEMWAQVKSGEIQVEGPCERRPILLPQS